MGPRRKAEKNSDSQAKDKFVKGELAHLSAKSCLWQHLFPSLPSQAAALGSLWKRDHDLCLYPSLSQFINHFSKLRGWHGDGGPCSTQRKEGYKKNFDLLVAGFFYDHCLWQNFKKGKYQEVCVWLVYVCY